MSDDDAGRLPRTSCPADEHVRAPALEMRGITKRYPGVVANDNIRPRGPAGRDPRAARRERRRQVHADEHPLWAGQARRGRDPAGWRAGRDRRSARRDRTRHQHGPPALHAGARPDRGREHPPRRRDHGQSGLPRPERGASPDRRTRQALRLRDRSRREGRPPIGRLAAARRDPQGALSRGQDPGARRAHGRADAAGDEGDLRGPAAPARRGPQHRLHQPQAVRGAGDRRPDHRHPAWQAWSASGSRRRQTRTTSPS